MTVLPIFYLFLIMITPLRMVLSDVSDVGFIETFLIVIGIAFFVYIVYKGEKERNNP